MLFNEGRRPIQHVSYSSHSTCQSRDRPTISSMNAFNTFTSQPLALCLRSLQTRHICWAHFAKNWPGDVSVSSVHSFPAVDGPYATVTCLKKSLVPCDHMTTPRPDACTCPAHTRAGSGSPPKFAHIHIFQKGILKNLVIIPLSFIYLFFFHSNAITALFIYFENILFSIHSDVTCGSVYLLLLSFIYSMYPVTPLYNIRRACSFLSIDDVHSNAPFSRQKHQISGSCVLFNFFFFFGEST